MEQEFRARLLRGDRLAGTFIKTPTHHSVEIAGASGLDFVTLDAEHAPFPADALDRCLLACAAARVAGVVRLADTAPATVLQALDLGAEGILAPHVTSAERARAVVAAARYQGGVRGFSNSPRAGGYGAASLPEHLAASDARSAVLCQIEDREAIDRLDEIASVEGVDCLFIGRADLTVSYQATSFDDPRVEDAVARTIAAGCAHGVPVGIFLGDAAQAGHYADLGVSLFIIGSDQSFMRAGLRQAAAAVRPR